MLKGPDLQKQSGYVKGFDTTSGVYSVEWSDKTEELLTESLVQKLIVVLPNGQWTPYKGEGVYVKLGKIMHEARIESAATDKQGHVIVRWDINNKIYIVNLKDVTPMLHQRKRIKRAPTIS